MPGETLATSTIRVPLSREPVPAWVMHEPYARPAQPEDTFIHGGLCKLLQDIQVDLTGAEEAWHFRNANYVVTQQGAETAAYVSADFDPHFQRLEIHFVRVLRGDEVLDRTNIEAFDILRRERDLERRILDGRLTAALVVPDVRPGDVVEVCLTLYGSNPVLSGHYSNWVGFDGVQPVLDLRHRVRHGKNRKLALHPINNPPAPVIAEKNGITEFQWRSARRTKFEYEPFSPPWLIQGAVTQLSDCVDWGEIAALFTSLYEVDAIPPELQKAIDALAADNGTPAARAAEVLRFVQKRLRYLALSFGEGGLTPRGIDTIWSTGYGDCKDAVRLFIAIARRLGLDACPALVSTSHSPILNTLLPSAGVFNHCIVRLRLDGKTYWLDPTIRTQSGNLDVVVQPFTGWALPLAADTAALEQMNAASPVLVIEVDEHVKFGPFVGTPAELERQTVYASWRADHLRDAIANQGLASIAETHIKELQPAWPGVAEAAPIRIEDQPEINKITLFETYKISNCWRRKTEDLVSFGTQDTAIGRELALLPGTMRKTDVHLGRPRIVRRFVHFHMPRNWTCNPWDRTMEMPGLTYRSKLHMDNKRLMVFSQLVAVSAESAPASHAERYNEIVRAIREKCDLALSAVNADGEIKHQKGGLLTGWRWVVIVFWALAFMSMIVNRLNGH